MDFPRTKLIASTSAQAIAKDTQGLLSYMLEDLSPVLNSSLIDNFHKWFFWFAHVNNFSSSAAAKQSTGQQGLWPLNKGKREEESHKLILLTRQQCKCSKICLALVLQLTKARKKHNQVGIMELVTFLQQNSIHVDNCTIAASSMHLVEALNTNMHMVVYVLYRLIDIYSPLGVHLP